MPTSRAHPIPYICEEILRQRPHSILDVGCGFGKWGVLLREYSDIWQGRLTRQDWKVRIDAVEIWPKYLTPVHRYVYSNIYTGDIREVIKTLDRYDWILAGDVLEHLPGERVLGIVQELMDKTGKMLIIIAPKRLGRTGGAFGNPHEAHKCVLSLEKLIPLIGIPKAFSFPYQNMWWFSCA